MAKDKEAREELDELKRTLELNGLEIIGDHIWVNSGSKTMALTDVWDYILAMRYNEIGRRDGTRDLLNLLLDKLGYEVKSGTRLVKVIKEKK